MAQSLSQMYLHIVFSTKSREKLILPEYEKRIYPYISTVCRESGCPVFEIGGVEDHIHILLELSRTMTVSKLIEQIKSNSSRWIKSQFSECRNFSWQRGYGVFSVGRSMLSSVKNYVQIQKEHHKHSTFKEEFLNLLDRAGIQYDERYLWD